MTLRATHKCVRYVAAFLHNAVAHPLMGVTRVLADAGAIAVDMAHSIHDRTARIAWPDSAKESGSGLGASDVVMEDRNG